DHSVGKSLNAPQCGKSVKRDDRARSQSRRPNHLFCRERNPVSDARNRFLRQLIQDAHSADSTRLVSAALQAHQVADGNRISIHIDDPIASDLDVLGNNEYIGWYVRRPADADSIDWVSDYNKPLIMSEFGGGGLFA